MQEHLAMPVHQILIWAKDLRSRRPSGVGHPVMFSLFDPNGSITGNTLFRVVRGEALIHCLNAIV